jgi:hypothetical protein
MNKKLFLITFVLMSFMIIIIIMPLISSTGCVVFDSCRWRCDGGGIPEHMGCLECCVGILVGTWSCSVDAYCILNPQGVCGAECAYGQSQDCDLRGSGKCGTQSRPCNSCIWGSWSTCALKSGKQCWNGDTQNCGAGSCGTQTCSGCTYTGTTCSLKSGNVCFSGQTRPCGNCNLGTETCTSCTWPGTCIGAGVCASGSTCCASNCQYSPAGSSGPSCSGGCYNGQCYTALPNVNFIDKDFLGTVNVAYLGGTIYKRCIFVSGQDPQCTNYNSELETCQAAYPSSNSFIKTSSYSTGTSPNNYNFYIYNCYKSYPAAGSPQNKTFEIEYSASDNSEIPITCKIKIRNGTTASWQDKGNIPCNINQKVNITVGIGKNCSAEGLNACGVRIFANNSAGRANETERNFTIDYTPPLISISYPNSGAELNSNFNVGYSATDAAAVSSCKLYVRNGDSAAAYVYKKEIPCGNNQEFSISIGSDCTIGGTNKCGVRIWANDTLNQISQLDRDFSISFALTTIILSPDAGSKFNSTFNINYTAVSPNNPVCKLQIRNGGAWQDKGNINCGVNKQIPITVGQGKDCSAEGLNACGIRILSSDDTGKTNRTERNFTIDYTPPSISINSPDVASWQNKNFSVNYSASDNVDISACNLFIRNGTNAQWTDKGNINCFANQVNITVGAGKNCSAEGLNACGIRIWANDSLNQLNYIERNFSIDYNAPSIEIKPVPLSYDYSFVTTNITFNISCYDAISGCSSLNYSYLNFNYSDKKYNSLNKFIFAKQIAGNNALDNVTCTDGNVCRTSLRVYASDNLGNVNTAESLPTEEFKIDLQKPVIEKVECTYKLRPSSSSSQCSKGTIIPGSNVTIVAFANDTTGNFIGSGVKRITVYLIDPEGKVSQLPMNLLGTIRKSSTFSMNATKIGEYVYTVAVEDEVGFNGANYSSSFFVGGDPNAKCNVSGNSLCSFYQVCSGIVVPSKDTNENLGITCCYGKCLNRSTLATCKQQGGEIYDKNLSTCLGTDTPASDTTEKNRCCKGTLATKTNSLAWYDMAGNKISGAARGDKVKCAGMANADAHFDIKITLGDKILFNQQNLKVSSTTKANSSIITLNETGTYKCEATFTASPPVTVAPINLKVIEAPTKPRYTELPGFSSIAMLIAIVGLMIYYLARRK